jgi:hypothetical protein
VFIVRMFPDDGGDLTSQPRGKKKRWVRTGAAIVAIKDGLSKTFVKDGFFYCRLRVDHHRRLQSVSETAHEPLQPWIRHPFTASERFNADV